MYKSMISYIETGRFKNVPYRGFLIHKNKYPSEDEIRNLEMRMEKELGGVITCIGIFPVHYEKSEE